jgi:hypothetical protein
MTEKPFCAEHPDVEPIVFRYCPACRGGHGGKKSMQTLTAGQRKKRAQKAARARWGKAKKR